MSSQNLAMSGNFIDRNQSEAARQWIHILGASSALLIVLTALVEILITFLPGGYTTAGSVTEWFALLQTNPLLGLRNLGLLNIVMTALGIPLTLTLYALVRQRQPSFAALALILSLIGVSVFYATNRALPMLDLSTRFSAATNAADKSMLAAAGQAMLATGQSHTAGTFLAFFFSEIGGILMAAGVLRAKLFHPTAAITGIAGYSLLLIFEIFSSFIPTTHDAILLIAMVGGISNITWYVLAAFGLLRRNRSGAVSVQ